MYAALFWHSCDSKYSVAWMAYHTADNFSSITFDCVTVLGLLRMCQTRADRFQTGAHQGMHWKCLCNHSRSAVFFSPLCTQGISEWPSGFDTLMSFLPIISRVLSCLPQGGNRYIANYVYWTLFYLIQRAGVSLEFWRGELTLFWNSFRFLGKLQKL